MTVNFFLVASLGDVVSCIANPSHLLLHCCSKHFCAVNLTTHVIDSNQSLCTLLLNVYLPTDYGTLESNDAFLDCLCELDGFISAQSFDNILICGDFNVDFS